MEFDIDTEVSYPTPFRNSSLLPMLLMALAVQKHTPDTKRFFKPVYDYIVVGAGSAGSVVAGRLSADPSKTVLLLEAGKSPPLLADLPGSYSYFGGTDLFWDHLTEPQNFAAIGQKNRRIPVGTGKVVGGSSVLNGMVYIRGNREDYNTWEELGAHGWGWDGVFPYFLKAEDNTDPDIAHNGYHARGGPLTVGRFAYNSEYKQPLIHAARRMGYTYRDANGACQSGLADLQGTVRRAQRVSSAKAYLVPNEDNPNLDIVAEAYVTKVLISNKTAWGVQFDFEGCRYEVRAKREVILSAGVVKSPQLLMLSGIGPRKTLQKFGIPVISDLPVGRNLQDHGATLVNFVVKDGPTITEKLQDVNNILRYIKNGTDSVSAQQYDVPDYELHLYEVVWESNPAFGLSPEVYDKLYGPYVNRPAILCLPHDIVPQSKGYVSIRSRNPYDPPIIDPQYYKVQQDVRHVVEGMKACYKLMGHPFMKELGIMPFETLMPGCEELLYDPDEYLECYARSFVMPTYHMVGSIKMGDIYDPNTVVDTHLRVKGINGLRVVDASVMPKITRGNPNGPVIMIAEKAAEIIIKECH